ncbi:MAG TPA: methyltransferase domain-containing protein [Candidatus Methanoperedens sp.]|nr:methyltransferase domain-containing protein [Candidatus Methanoperedens sp.]
MSDLWYLALASLAVSALGLLAVRLYRELFFFEGIRLSDRLHVLLYDLWARTYDAGKMKVQRDDARTLVEPLLERLEERGANTADALLLDAATGTGRLPVALLGDPRFTGRVVGLDISAGMLREAGKKLSRFGGRSVLLHQKAAPLPFPGETFDAVSCLETVELLPDRDEHFREFLRVMKPDGILLATRNTGEWGRAGAVRPPERFADRLRAAGFERVEIRPWWSRFDLVWARRPPAGASR